MDMTPGHKQWKKFTLTGDALSAAWWPCPPFTWNNSISLGLNLFILITISRVCQLAFQYAKINGITGFSDESQTAGRKWLSGFLKHNPGIRVKKAQNLAIACAMGANPTVIGNWFKLLAEVKQKC